MTSMQEMVKRDIERYTQHGMSLEGAARQVKGLRRGHWDRIVDQVVEQIRGQQ